MGNNWGYTFSGKDNGKKTLNTEWMHIKYWHYVIYIIFES